MTRPLWQPGEGTIAHANLTRFMAHSAEQFDLDLASYDDLHSWSITHPGAFWQAVWDTCGVIGDKGVAPYAIDGNKMPGARFFPQARLNFSENLLRKRDHSPALVFWAEDKVKRAMSWAQLTAQATQFQACLDELEVAPGSRIAAMMPNMPETMAAMLGATASGAVWSSCSPDFGVKGVLDRFGQIEPEVLVTCDGYYYNGKVFSITEKLREIVPALPSLKRVVVVPFAGDGADTVGALANATNWNDDVLSRAPGVPRFEQLPFDHPLYILFSSGTTGVPKCIVHSVGGTLLQHQKEQVLHCDLKEGERLFFFTTCGWMMWNWLATALAAKATLMLYDGSPFHPSGEILFDYAEAERFDLFGTSAKYIDALKKAGLKPRESHDLSRVRIMMSTGSPLAPESFDYVYSDIKPDIHLASMSGGTDIISCFVLGNPVKPVWRGEIQCAGLGMATDVFDENGRSMPRGKGELVCANTFPSMPIGFWNDPDGRKYHNAYFARFDNIWCHGDFAEWTDHGGMIIHGRSDATLNPGGVRIGTSEIYRQVEQLEEVVESIVIGQDWDHDVRVVLFVVLAEGVALSDDLVGDIKRRIREGASPRHVPAKIVAVRDIPRTKSGKITELAVRDLVHGREIKNKEALANPEALELFKDIPELARP